MRRQRALVWLPSKHLDSTMWLPKQDIEALTLGWALG